MRATAEAAPGKGRVGLILVETPANPTNGLIDLVGIATIAMSWASSMLSSPVVDNTILGLVFQKPLLHGVDVTLCSLIKHID
jgi:methionine-gamma-lyase